jgi:hypothetical protein
VSSLRYVKVRDYYHKFARINKTLLTFAEARRRPVKPAASGGRSRNAAEIVSPTRWARLLLGDDSVTGVDHVGVPPISF